MGGLELERGSGLGVNWGELSTPEGCHPIDPLPDNGRGIIEIDIKTLIGSKWRKVHGSGIPQLLT